MGGKKTAYDVNRTCSSCENVYPATKEFFALTKACILGISYACKKCENAKRIKWRKENKEKLHKQWKEKYCVAHKQARIKRDQYYIENAPEKRRAMQMAVSTRTRCRKNNIPFDIHVVNKEYLTNILLENSMCPICNIPFEYKSPYEKGDKPFTRSATPSIDKIIPKLGYVKNNVAIICWGCNMMKSDYSLEKFERLVAWLRHVQPLGNEVGKLGNAA